MSPLRFCFLFFFFLFRVCPLEGESKDFAAVIPGIEVLIRQDSAYLKGKRLGLITNQTGVDRNLQHDVDLLRNVRGAQLVSLFAPEHGIRGVAQAGEKVDSAVDPASGLIVYSLYGKNLQPTPEMLEGIDLLVYDIQDMGLRFYTYISTLAECMKAAATNKISFLVLDRPAPLNGLQVEGNILEEPFRSMVGPFPIPIRYGFTPGELALWIKDYLHLNLQLKVIQMKNWHRSLWYDETGLIWVPPSPNLPTLDSALVYAGTCFLEGTNVSEGRGTAKPFEILGAPWINGFHLADRLNALGLAGVRFRPVSFSPNFSKFRGEICQGVQIHVIDRNIYSPIQTGLKIVALLRQMYPKDFTWLEKHFDRLAGNGTTRLGIEQGETWDKISSDWPLSLRQFLAQREKYLLYP